MLLDQFYMDLFWMRVCFIRQTRAQDVVGSMSNGCFLWISIDVVCTDAVDVLLHPLQYRRFSGWQFVLNLHQTRQKGHIFMIFYLVLCYGSFYRKNSRMPSGKSWRSLRSASCENFWETKNYCVIVMDRRPPPLPLSGADPGFWSGGAQRSFTPRGAWAKNFLKIGGFLLKCLKTAWF